MEINVEQKTEPWFAVRRCYITGTMFAILMGKNPYMSLSDVLDQMERDRMGLPRKTLDPKSQRNVDWGNLHETDGIAEYEKKVLGFFPPPSPCPILTEFPSLSTETDPERSVTRDPSSVPSSQTMLAGPSLDVSLMSLFDGIDEEGEESGVCD